MCRPVAQLLTLGHPARSIAEDACILRQYFKYAVWRPFAAREPCGCWAAFQCAAIQCIRVQAAPEQHRGRQSRQVLRREVWHDQCLRRRLRMAQY